MHTFWRHRIRKRDVRELVNARVHLLVIISEGVLSLLNVKLRIASVVNECVKFMSPFMSESRITRITRIFELDVL